MSFFPSKEQKDFKEYIEDGSKNNKKVKVNIKAPAGSGKTSSILYLLETFTQTSKCLYLVFNTQMNKEMQQRLNFANSPFDINKDNLEQYTFHGYIRKQLQKKLPNIGFDYQNGSLSDIHFNRIFQKYNIILEDKQSSNLFIESFNSFINPFVKDIISLDKFQSENEVKQLQVNTEVFDIARRLGKVMDLIPFNMQSNMNLSNNERDIIVKKVFYGLMEEIFENKVLNDFLPHDIYYKYIDLHYGNINLFEDYEYVFVDEAQDIDKIITELLNKSNVNLIKLGDTFQKINGFRGTVNSLGNDNETKTFYLTASYRLTPYMGFITEAFLKKEGIKFGYEPKEIPSIFGYSKNDISLTKSKIKQSTDKEYFKTIIDDLSKVDIYESYTFHDVNKNRKKIEESIKNGKKSLVEKSFKEFMKNKNYIEFYNTLYENTDIFIDDTLDKKEEKIYGLETKENIDFIKELNKLARDYTFKLTKKEMREILSTENGSYGYFTRNNKKAIDVVHKFVKDIPNEQLSEIPLFNIKFTLSSSDAFDSLRKNNFKALSTQEKAVIINQLNSIETKDFIGSSVWDLKLKLSNIEIPDKILSKFLENTNNCIGLADIKFLQISGKKVSLSDLGATGIDIKNIVENNIKQIKTVKTKNKDNSEITIQDLKDITYMKGFDKLVPLDKLLRSQVDLDFFTNQKMSMTENFYKYSEIKDAVKNNPNIELVNDGAYYNIFVSTTHQVKGLEFDNIMVANDIYVIKEEEGVDIKTFEEEFNIAYVALTRTKGTVFLEEGSPLISNIDNIVKDGYERYYQIKNSDVLVIESLSDKTNNQLPSYEIIIKDEAHLKIKREKAYLFDGVSYPNIKKMQFAINSSTNDLKVIEDLDEKTRIELIDSGYKIEALSHLEATPTEINEIINNWENDIEQKKEEIEVDLKNNPYGF